MAFNPSEIQVRILQALEQLEIQGCRTATETGKPAEMRYRFGYGVPTFVMKAWFGITGPETLWTAMPPLSRRGLVKRKPLEHWPLMPTRILTTDGRVILILHEQISPQPPRKKPKATRARKRKSQELDLLAAILQARNPGLYLASYTGTLDGTKFRNVVVNRAWYAKGAGDCYTITEKGLALFDDSDGEPEISELVTLRQMAALIGYSPRTLDRWLADGEIPPPDFHGGNGVSRKWYYHNLRPAVERKSKHSILRRFPASRIL